MIRTYLAGETTSVPAPPVVPSPADFPAVPPVEPARLARRHGTGLALGLAAALAAAAVAKWATGGAIETAPIVFGCAVAAGWWLGRTLAISLALAGALAWSAASLAHGPTLGLGASALLALFALPALAAGIGAARAHESGLRTDELRREQARSVLALQLRESVVSIDVAVPLLADPMRLDRAQGAAFDQVRRHSRTLLRLANDLLALDQVDARRMELIPVQLDLAAFVLEIAEQKIPHDRATIVTPSTPVPVNADPERLRQVIDHLLQNALKFSPPGASVMVVVSATADEAKVEVRDHGVGLSADDLKVLFTRYGRIRDARTANVPGMGVGLYLSRLVAEAHGGSLSATSPGRGLGAAFALTLPIAGRPARPARSSGPTSSFWD